jgi:hypothetical protein
MMGRHGEGGDGVIGRIDQRKVSSRQYAEYRKEEIESSRQYQ